MTAKYASNSPSHVDGLGRILSEVEMIQYLFDHSFFDQTVYIVPNNYGPTGYALIPWLLLFFERVAVYAPSSQVMGEEIGVGSDQPFSEAEFRDAVLQGEIVPAAFETFLSRSVRSQYYPNYLQPTSRFDADLMDTTSELGQRLTVVSNDFKNSNSPTAAAEIVDASPLIVNRMAMRVRSGRISKRLSDL